MKTEVDVRKQAAERFAAAKAAKAQAVQEEQAAAEEVKVVEQKPPPEPKRLDDYAVGTVVRSFTVSHAVPILGSELRSISAERESMRGHGLRIRIVKLGTINSALEVAYRGTDLRPRTLIVPSGNVASFEPEL